MTVDVKTLTIEELEGLFREVHAELLARRTIAEAEERAEEIAREEEARLAALQGDYHKARARGRVREDGAVPWVQPTGAHDAFPLGAVVIDDQGREWESIMANNVWRPGDDSDGQNHLRWKPRDFVPPDSKEWAPGQNVVVGQEVYYQGHAYKVLQPHRTQSGWEPPNVPALFQPATQGTNLPGSSTV